MSKLGLRGRKRAPPQVNRLQASWQSTRIPLRSFQCFGLFLASEVSGFRGLALFVWLCQKKLLSDFHKG